MATIESEKAELEKRFKQELKELINQASYKDVNIVIDQIRALFVEAGQMGITLSVSIDDLLTTADEKVKEVVRREVAEREILAQKQAEEERHLEEAAEKVKLEALLAESARLQEQHATFQQEIDPYLRGREQERELLEEILEDYNQEGKVNLSKLAMVLKPPERIKKNQETRDKAFKLRKETKIHCDNKRAYVEEKKATIRTLQQEVELDPSSTASASKIAKIKYLDKQLTDFDIPTLRKDEKMEEEANKGAEDIEKQDLEIAKWQAKFKERLSSADKEQQPAITSFLDMFEQQNKPRQDSVIHINPRQSFLDMFVLQEGRSPKNLPHVPNDVTKERGGSKSQHSSALPLADAKKIRKSLTDEATPKGTNQELPLKPGSTIAAYTPSARSGNPPGRER